MKTILCVSHVVPWPGAHGNEIRLQRLLLWLRKQGYRIILVITCTSVPPEQLRHVRQHVDRLEIASHSRGTFVAAKATNALLSCSQMIRSRLFRRGRDSSHGTMQALADLICPDSVRRVVRNLHKEETIDAFFAYYAFALQAFDDIPSRKNIICDSVEVFSMQHHDSTGKATKRVLNYSAAEERAMLLKSHQIMAIQSAEAEYLSTLIPERRILTVGIDYDVPSDPGLPSEAGDVIGIIGSDNQANREGLQQFLCRCWPLIRARVPTARLWVAGAIGTASCSEHNQATANGVEIRGWIKDISEFYRGLRLAVNPVQMGTGLKIKTVEALAHCRPVVAYPIGCEGIDPEAASAWCMVNDPTAMADACASLLLTPSRCDAMAEQAKNYALAALSANSVYKPLGNILDEICTNQDSRLRQQSA